MAASPDRFAQAQRIDEEIAELQRRKQAVLEGRGGTATTAQLSEQLRDGSTKLPCACLAREGRATDDPHIPSGLGVSPDETPSITR